MKYPAPIQEFYNRMQIFLDDTPEKDTNIFLGMSSNKVGTEYHMTMGMAIRNEYIHSKEGELYDYVKKIGFLHADDVSGFLLETFHMYTTGVDFDFEALANQSVQRHENFWKTTYPNSEMPEL